MKPQVETLINPLTVRFSLWNETPVYHFAGDSETQLDGIEKMMGVDPAEQEMLDINLGFLPISSTTLIRGNKNIIVDPGNFHVGFYGLLSDSLEQKGLSVDQIDMVVVTHSHLDHMASTHLFPESKLIIHEQELTFARDMYWPEFIDAITVDRLADVEYITSDEGIVELCEGVSILPTPGHTPGSISLFVETENKDIAIIGDVAMTEEEYKTRDLSHWYTEDQIVQINESMDKIEALDPDVIIPGHDKQFQP